MNKGLTLGLCTIVLCAAVIWTFQAAPTSASPAGFSGTPHYLPIVVKYAAPTATNTESPTVTPYPTYTSEPTQTQLPASVYVIGNTFAFADLQHVHVIGEVFNNTAGPVQLVKVTARLYNASHQLMAVDFNWTFLNHIPAQQKTCFDIPLSIPANWSTYEVDAPTYFDSSQGWPNMAIVNPSVLFDPNNHHYDSFGQVRNDEQTPVHAVHVVQTLYADDGTPLGCGGYYGGDLSPTQSGSFSMQFNNRNYSDVASWTFQADGDIQ